MKKDKRHQSPFSYIREFMGMHILDHTMDPSPKHPEKLVCVFIDAEPKEDALQLFSVEYDPKEPSNLNKAIEDAKAWIKALRRCRKCGCTEHDCRQCISKTGNSCFWVEEDLCSACKEEEPKIVVTDSRAMSGAVDDAPANPTNFFSELLKIGNVDITLRIMQKGENFTLNVMPGSNASVGIQPMIVSGKASDLDMEFFKTIAPAVKEVAGIIQNINEVKSSATQRAEKKSSQKKASRDKSSSKKSKSTKPVTQKAKTPGTPKKVLKKKPEPIAKKTIESKVVEPSLFESPTETV